MTFRTPAAKAAVADEALSRPDWRISDNRDPAKLWLDKNENVDPTLAAVVRSVLQAVPDHAAWTYPDVADLYGKLARVAGVDPENLILAAGSDGIIRSVFEAFVSPGDVVLHTNPTFAMYSVYAQMYGAKATAIDYEPSQAGPKLPTAKLVDAIRRFSPRLVCLPNPDSPTGSMLERAKLRKIIEAATEVEAVILIDEAYYPFQPETAVDLIQIYPNLVIARSTGKAWGMAGLRIGYGIAPAALTLVLHKVRPMYEVGSVSAWTFYGMLDRETDVLASVDRLNKGKEGFLSAMDNLGLPTLRGAGNFLHVAFSEHGPSVHKALAELVYYRRDFSHPSLAGFSRFSSATPDQFAPIVARIESVISTNNQK